MLKRFALVFVFTVLVGAGFGATVRPQRYAVMLKEEPVARVAKSRAALRSASAQAHAARVEETHTRVKALVRERGVRVLGETRVLANAIFVSATREQARELRNLPGVGGVVELPRIQRRMNRVLNSTTAPQAWANLGGRDNAGDGVRVAVIDTGIDVNHPAFQNSPLTAPSGFPRTRFPADAPFTNNKVIVARSYVPELADDGIAGGNPSSDEQIQLTRPDDYSARDRVGHGTAIGMIIAGQQINSPIGQMSGIAPGAFLGNYKVFGSPGVNDGTFADVVMMALEDAFVTDEMNIAVLSLGSPAVWGPLDDTACGNDPGVPCDALAAAAGTAAQSGMVVIASSGNSGDSGGLTPTFASIESPGTHPDVLTVGAVQNSHEFFRTLDVAGGPNGSVGPGEYRAALGGTIVPSNPITAPLRDVRETGNDGLACAALPGGSMNGSIAFIARGSGECTFAVKMQNAQNAGAVGVVFYRTDGSNEVFSPGGLEYARVPSMLIGSSDGTAVRNFLDGLGNAPNATISAALTEREVDVDADNNGIADSIISAFSSRGPNIGFPLIKPEVVSVGEEIYTATQTFDKNSDMYDPSGFLSVSGTSFSAPIAAGIAALILDNSQGAPFFDSEDVKSAIVNSARDVDQNFNYNVFDQNLETGNFETPAYNVAAGGGAAYAFGANDVVVTMFPQTLDFGEVTDEDLAAGIEVTVRITNYFNQQLRFTLTREPYVPSQDQASPVVWTFPAQIDVPAGGFQDVTFRLTGTAPSTRDFYDGVILVEGSGTVPELDVKIPYLYIRGDFAPCNIIPLRGNGRVGIVNESGPSNLSLKVTDCRGLPIADVPITWTTTQGSGVITSSSLDGFTDEYGIVESEYVLGPELGVQSFEASYPDANGVVAEFNIRTIGDPVVEPAGIVEGAGFAAGRAVAPGSFVSIFGTNLGSGTLDASTLPLPIALGELNVSIDTRNRQVSVPARLNFVSPSQVNIFLPWELAGQSEAVIKVNIGDISTAVREVSLATYSPGLFQYFDPGVNQQILAAQIFRNGTRLGLHSSTLRAQSGDVLELYANGLGPLAGGNPPTGEPSPSNPVKETATLPEVRVNGILANVEFSGLAPGFVGLYQVNIGIPGGLTAGTYDVVITIGGVSSLAGKILIQ